MLVTGPGLWIVSQTLLVLYFKLDNGANTCVIDFHFEKSNKTKRDLAEVEVNENEESFPLNPRSNSTSRVEESASSDQIVDSGSDNAGDVDK